MKAVVTTKYGPPDVLQLKEVQKPVPKDNEVLIKIHATTVTTAGIAQRKGEPFMIRFFLGLLRPKQPIQGVELAGVIEATGKDVKRFKFGDPVFGEPGVGSYAEYICMPDEGLLELKPTNISFEVAAASCDGVLTALPFIRDKGNIQSGHSILISGASGSIGSFAVQLAKHFGAEVTGVCSTSNLELVRSLGADNVIDYTKEDFTNTGQTYDIIFDAVGKISFSQSKGSLKEGGIYLSATPGLSKMLPYIGSKKAIFHATGLRSLSDKKKDLLFLKGLIEEGKIRTVIDRRYPLEELAEAHTYVEKGHKKGNVVIIVVPNDET